MAKAQQVNPLRLRDNCFDKNAVLFEAQEDGRFQSKGSGDDTLPGGEQLTITEVTKILSHYGGMSLDELRSESILDLTPKGHLDDKERKELVFFSYEDEKKEVGGKVESFRLGTSNLMGVLRFRDAKNKVSVQVEVLSRFDKGKDNFFLSHMLSKVMDVSFGFNKVSSKRESMLDFLLDVVFVNYLARAMRDGLFKQYRERRNNDWNFKGRLDLPRHLRENVPLMHGIAYVKREIEHDVPLNQMILLAAKEVRKRQPGIFDRNEDARNAFRQLQINIPNPGTARDVLRQRTCREPVTHPYFQETYEPLRKVAKMILEGEQWSLFADNGDAEVSGVVFDGSWLWENYLNSLLHENEALMESEFELVHCDNSKRTNPIYPLLLDDEEYHEVSWYPDFYLKKGNEAVAVLDAKYKHLDTRVANGKYLSDDVHEVLSYMYALEAKKGFLLYPYDKDEDKLLDEFNLSGFGGNFHFVGMKIPQSSEYSSFKNYCEAMKDAEDRFIETLNKRLSASAER